MQKLNLNKLLIYSPHDNAEKGDWLAHLGKPFIKMAEKKKVKELYLKVFNKFKLIKNNEDSFKINVWISGAYLRLAKILINDQKIKQAEIYLFKGEEIVLQDPRLVIRKQQLEILKKKINQ